MSHSNRTNGAASTVCPDPLERMPVHFLESERQLLGCMLRSNAIVPDVADLRAADFYGEANGRIFAAISDLCDKGKQADITTVFEWARRHKCADDVQPVYLAQLHSEVSSAFLYSQYADTIRDASLKRQLGTACREIQAETFDPTEPAGEMIGRAERRILAIAERTLVSEAATVQDAMRGALDRIDERRTAGHDIGIPTGFADLDTILTGLQKGEMTILAARPSVGKTSLALGIAANAVKWDVPTLFISLEQAKTELAERLLCSEARISSHAVRRGHLSAEMIDRLLAANELFADCKLFIDDAPGQNMLRIAASARRFVRRQAVRLLIVDYLQLIEPDDRRKPEHEQISATSRRLKCLARELNISVLALCQLNRESEAGNGREPRLSDLRGSGAIEQDSDAVLLMHRPDASLRSSIMVRVAKNRNGPVGSASLFFHEEYMRFENSANGDL